MSEKSRYKLLNSVEIKRLPDLKWRVKGMLPDSGLAGLYGASGSGKSFLALDLGIAIAEGLDWFGCRVERAPVVYCVLEGEGGIKQRVQAWEAFKQRNMPRDMFMVLQAFQLTSAKDVADLAEVIPLGSVVFIDTLNRAVAGVDENSSKDMGMVLGAAKLLQSLVRGLVVIVHHTGKDAWRGLRGHSSLVAALDASIEVKNDCGVHEFMVAKSKDGRQGVSYTFDLKIQVVGRDDYGDEITSCVVDSGFDATCILKVNVPSGGNQKLIYDAIVKLMTDGGVAGVEGLPGDRMCVTLLNAIRVGATALDCINEKRNSRAKAVIAGLVKRGILGTDEKWIWIV